ncbi:hypothetical protein ACROYT_G035106 [Oculina patagonica]
MVVLTIDASSNGEAVYFDQPIEKPRFISLLSCSLQNSWHNLEEIGSISIKQNNVSNNVAVFFPGNYNFDEITTYLTNKFKDQQKLTVKRDDLKRGFSITKTKSIESFSFDKNLSKLFKNTIVDASNARIEDFTIPDFYYIHCDLLSKENNLYNGKPSDILACVPITGKPYDLVHYPQNFINNSRRIDAVQSVNSVTLTVKDKTGRNYHDSLVDAKSATELQPTFLNAIVRGASACVQLNQFQEAMEWCDKGLALDKDNKTLLELKARCVRERNKVLETPSVKGTPVAGITTPCSAEHDDCTLRSSSSRR